MSRIAQAKGGTKRTAVSRNEVVIAAIKLIDEAGIDAFTMRALAKELDVFPATLYWHAGSKADLLAAVSTRLFDDVVLPDEHQIDWAAWLVEVARRCRAALHAHPEIALIAGSRMVVSATAVPLIERILGVLQRAGFTGTALVRAYNAYIGFTLGWTTLELSSEPVVDDADWKANFADELASLDRNAFPVLTAHLDIVQNNAFMVRYNSGRTRPMDDSFEAAARILVAGLRAEFEVPD